MGADALQAIHGIEIFPVISLLLFVIVFTVMVVRAVVMGARQADAYARLPLGEEDGAISSRTASEAHTRKERPRARTT